MEAKEAGTATCTAVQQPHTEPSLTPQHRKWIRAAFLQAFAALVSKSSGVLMLLLPRSPVLTRALSPGPCAAPAPPWVPLCRGSPGTGLGLCAAGGARTALKQSPAPSPLQPPCFTSSSPRYSPKRVLHRALGPAVLRKAPTGAARGVTAGLWHTGTASCSVLPGKGAAAAAAVPGPWSHQPAGSSLSTPCDSIDQTRPRLSRGSLK